MNSRAVLAIYLCEMRRARRHWLPSIVAPVMPTLLYVAVFSSAMGSQMANVDGVSYGTFLVPGLVMMSVLTGSISDASMALYVPKVYGSIYEVLSAPVSYKEIVLGYGGTAAIKSIIMGLLILAISSIFVPLHVEHPIWMLCFLALAAIASSIPGLLIGMCANELTEIQLIPVMVVTPLAFLGCAFYSPSILPPMWRAFILLDPLSYLISAFRWSFYGVADLPIAISIALIGVFVIICLAIARWMLRTGYRLKT